VSVAVTWLSVFADVPAARLAPACRFWAAITGTTAGAPKGENGEFTPLRTPDGDGFLWLQRVGRDDGGWHPDLHVRDVAGARQLAIDCGAKVVSDAADLVALQTPAGQPFCLVGDDRPQRQRPPAPAWPSGRSLADQLCLDIPAAGYEDDTQFWTALTGWPSSSTDLPEFRRINPPGALPVQFLLQRLGDDDTAGARAHLDMSADDRGAEVARHEALGATIVNVTDGWTTLTDPVGLTYCVTGRRPGMPAR
jgi:Glyoxalase-like domain